MTPKLFAPLFAAINNGFRKFGFEIKQSRSLPRFNWLGLRNISFSSILDVGANEGQFAVEAHRLFPKAHIYSFEPIGICFEKLRVKCQESAYWTCYNLALAEIEKSALFNLHEDNMPSSSLLGTTTEEIALYPASSRQRQVEVRCTTLDHWSSALGSALQRPTMLKLDVQGYELNVLRGGGATLQRIDAVICEINIRLLYENQSSFLDIVNLLYTRGLYFHGVLEHAYDHSNNVIAFDAVFRRNANQ